MRKRSIGNGFTLVELLVIVAIVLILLAILIPAIQKVRVTALKVQDANNLRTIGFALHKYVIDHDGKFPKTTHGGVPTSQTWWFKLEPNFDSIDDFLVSPLDPKVFDRKRFNTATSKNSSYLPNGYLTAPGPSGDDYTHRRSINSLSRTVAFFTGSFKRGVPGGDHSHPRNWFVSPDPNIRWNSVTGTTGLQPNSFTGGSHFLYLDGHVESIAGSQIREWVETGFDFAKPPQ